MSDAGQQRCQLLTGFLEALGFSLEIDGSTVWAKRTVAGEEVIAVFHILSGSDGDDLREAARHLSKAGRSEPGASLNLIYERRLPDKEVERLSDAGIKVLSQTEYLNSAIQADRVARESIEDAEKYIPEGEYVDQAFAPDGVGAIDYLRRWMTTPDDSGLLIVLGQAGHGKTCLANQLARGLARDHLREAARPAPFLMPLHRHRHVRRFEELVLTHLQDRGIHGFTSAAFSYLVRTHRILPVLDGFDELAETGGIKVARETLKGLLSQLDPSAKILLTSRQAYFRHRGDLSLLGSEQLLTTLQTKELAPFDETRRSFFLQRRGLSKSQAKEIESCIRDLNAEELLASPLMLKILSDELKAGGKLVGSSATAVLELSLTRICEREKGKGSIPWSESRQLELLTDIADLMNESRAYELEDPDAWLKVVVEQDVPSGTAGGRRAEAVAARVTQLKNHPLLVATEVNSSDAISFPHPLYRDFFIARDFRAHSAEDNRIRNALRAGLPEGSANFLADSMTEAELADLVAKATTWKEDLREVWQIALAKCDQVSPSDPKQRTATLSACLGSRRTFDYENLSRLRFSLLRFEGFSFVGANLTTSAFQGCEFRKTDLNGAQLAGCRFYECSADESTADAFERVGISIKRLGGGILGRKTLQVENEDPVRELVKRFFRRFIRDERGKNQKTAKKESMVAGLGGEERKFTERELIPEMKKQGIVGESHAAVDVYVFNSAWQVDGDAMIWDEKTTDRVQAIVERLRGKASRYSLV